MLGIKFIEVLYTSSHKGVPNFAQVGVSHPLDGTQNHSVLVTPGDFKNP